MPCYAIRYDIGLYHVVISCAALRRGARRRGVRRLPDDDHRGRAPRHVPIETIIIIMIIIIKIII